MKRNLLFKAVFQVLLAILLLCSILALFSCQNDVPENKKDNGKLEYKVNSDGETCTITGLGTYSSKSLIVPENIDGYTVTAIANCAFQGTDIVSFEGADTITQIGQEAFKDCKQLREVTMPLGVTKISECCFENCENLYVVNLSPNLEIIEHVAFAYCYALNSINLPDGIHEIGDYAFYLCINMPLINIPNTVKKIGGFAFGGCQSLEEIIIPNSVISINTGAFCECLSLKELYIPASVKQIGECLIGYTNLTEIKVDPKSPDLSTIDGNLYRSDNRTLINYAPGKTDTSFKIPESVTVIAGGAFMGSLNLTTIYIPNTVTNIGSVAFAATPNMETLYYDGTINEWNSIVKAENWNEDTKSTFIIICTDGIIAMDGTVTYN